MDEVGLLPQRSRSKRILKKGSTTKTTISSATPRTTTDRPSLVSRSSAPLLPSFLESESPAFERDWSQRDSIASLKDDPFFRNYQSPSSVNLAKELRSANYSAHTPKAQASNESLSQSSQRLAVNTGVVPAVCSPSPHYNHTQTDEDSSLAFFAKRDDRHQHCRDWKCWSREVDSNTTMSWATSCSNRSRFE